MANEKLSQALKGNKNAAKNKGGGSEDPSGAPKYSVGGYFQARKELKNIKKQSTVAENESLTKFSKYMDLQSDANAALMKSQGMFTPAPGRKLGDVKTTAKKAQAADIAANKAQAQSKAVADQVKTYKSYVNQYPVNYAKQAKETMTAAASKLRERMWGK
jgi:hypothetical protein